MVLECTCWVCADCRPYEPVETNYGGQPSNYGGPGSPGRQVSWHWRTVSERAVWAIGTCEGENAWFTFTENPRNSVKSPIFMFAMASSARRWFWVCLNAYMNYRGSRNCFYSMRFAWKLIISSNQIGVVIFSEELSKFHRFYTCKQVFAILAVQLTVTTIIATATLEKYGFPLIMDSYRAAKLILEATFARLHYHIIWMFYLCQLRTCQAFANVDRRNPPASLMLLLKQEWQHRKLASWCIVLKPQYCHCGRVFWIEMSSTDGKTTSGCKFNFMKSIQVVSGSFTKHSDPGWDW